MPDDAWSKRRQQLDRYERQQRGRKSRAVLPTADHRGPTDAGHNYDLDIAVQPLAYKSPKLVGTRAEGEQERVWRCSEGPGE